MLWFKYLYPQYVIVGDIVFFVKNLCIKSLDSKVIRKDIEKILLPVFFVGSLNSVFPINSHNTKYKNKIKLLSKGNRSTRPFQGETSNTAVIWEQNFAWKFPKKESCFLIRSRQNCEETTF